MCKLGEIYLKIFQNKAECFEMIKKAIKPEEESKLKADYDAIEDPLERALKSIKYAALDNEGILLHSLACSIFTHKHKWSLAIRSALYLIKQTPNANIFNSIKQLTELCNIIN